MEKIEFVPDFSVFQWLFNFKFILSSSWIKLCSAGSVRPEPFDKLRMRGPRRVNRYFREG